MNHGLGQSRKTPSRVTFSLTQHRILWLWSPGRHPHGSIQSAFYSDIEARVPAPEKGHFIIQLKSAATGMAHREATIATFDAFTPTREGTWTLDIDVNNSLLGIAFMTYGFCKMIIWNWREGEMIMVS
jgi:hypothetical protein